MGFSRQEYWSGCPFPFPGNLLDPGIKPRSPSLQVASCIAGRFFTIWATTEAPISHGWKVNKDGVVQASTTSPITLPGQEISLQCLWAMVTDPPWWRLLIIKNVFLRLGQFSLTENFILLCSSCLLFAFLHAWHFCCLDTCSEFFPRAHCCVGFADVQGSECTSLGTLKCQYLKWCPWQGMILVMVLKHGETVLWLRQYHFVYLSIARKRSDNIQAEFQH